MNIKKRPRYYFYTTLFIFAMIGIVIFGGYTYLEKNWIDYKSYAVSNSEVFRSPEELKDFSPVIVEVTNTGVSQPFNIQIGSSSTHTMMYTKTEVVIDRVVKGENLKEGKIITVIEGYQLVENKGIVPGKSIMALDKYTPMVPNAKYLLYLAWVEERDGYWIVANDKGKFNIDGKDQLEYESEYDPIQKKLRKEILSKYNLSRNE